VTWEVRAVDQTGTLVSTVAGVNVVSIQREINARERCELSIDPLEADATLLDLFSHEVQVWHDTDLYGWFRPARVDADVSSNSSSLRVSCEGLFSYFHDEVIGGERPNHIVSPHEDASAVGAAPASWTATAGVEDVAIVDNNVEFASQPKAIQVNNSEADEDAYIYQRYTVPSGFDRVPFAAMAYAYVADDNGGAPAYGGAALKERGLMIFRLSSDASTVMSKSKIAKITDETPRNQVVRLQTPQVLPLSGEIIEVRCYAPDAWTVWRFVGLYDGRALSADLIDKSAAFVLLVEHAQDTAIGKQDRNIDTDVVSLGEAVAREWPWWRRDIIGEQIDQLADTFEFEMAITSTTRTLKARATIGTDLSGTVTLTKEDFVAWGLGSEIGRSASRVIRQGEGSEVARDEWWTDDPAALNGTLVEQVTFAPPGESLQALRDNAAVDLERLKKIEKLPRARIVGDLALSIRPGDTVAVDIDHGWAQFTGDARVMSVDLDPSALAAMLVLEAA
jgi:hypothetical protein